MRRISAALAALFVGIALAIGPSAYATTGHLGPNEYLWIDTTGDSNTHTEVDNHCNCTGDLLWTGTRYGNPTRGFVYDTGLSGHTDYVYYVKRDDGHWHAYNKLWCNDNTGVCSDPLAV